MSRVELERVPAEVAAGPPLVRARPPLLAGVRVVARRELAATFESGIGHVVAIGFVLLANAIFANDFFLAGRVDMTPWFERLPYLFVLFLPAISMRLWAEERRARTFEVLVTLPLAPLQLVLGKYLAALALLALLLAGGLPVVLMLAWLGSPDPGLILGGFMGAAACGALLLALGALLSALCRDQIVAFVASVLCASLLVLSGHERVVAVLDGLAPALAAGTRIERTLSLLPHYQALTRGVVSLSALVYFAGLSAALLAANALVVARTRD